MGRSGHRPGRTGAVVLAAAVAGVLGSPGAAGADVTTNPTAAPRGGAVKLELVVPEERPGSTTRQVEVRLPAAAPIAEVYPMSVPGWAPRITTRTLDRPVEGMHAAGITSVTSAVTWIRVAGGGGPARLALSMGPLPAVDRLTFEVVQTYADGTVVRWADPGGGAAHPAPVLTLTPAEPGPAAGHAGHAPAGAPDAGPAGGGTAEAGAAPAAVPGADGADGSGGIGATDALLGAGLLGGLGLGALAGWLVNRFRRRPATPVPVGTTGTR